MKRMEVITPSAGVVRSDVYVHNGSKHQQEERPVVGKPIHVYLRDKLGEKGVWIRTKCQCIYVHPKNHYYVVQTPLGYKETFKWGCAS